MAVVEIIAETKTRLAKLQASMLCAQAAAYAAHYWACTACWVLQSLKDRRTRWLQTLFGAVEVERSGSRLIAAA